MEYAVPPYGRTMMRPSTPYTLSHYTNLVGLVGIVDYGEIWASNVSFLNDRRELQYGLDAAAKVVKKFASKETYAEWHKPLSTALARLRAGRIPNTYAACFCEKSDLLSQWRGYGGAEQGVAIAFNRSKLGDALKGINRDSPYEPRTGANFCAFPAFRQDRLAARMTAVTPGVPNGGRGADLAIFTGIGAHSSHRLLLNA
jgi:hypothetical protein